MSKDLQKPEKQSEEVDLGQLFKAIGNMFERLFNFIKSIFLGVFKLLVLALKPVVENIKILSVILGVCTLTGYVWDTMKKDLYYSQMLVKPHFESKYKLSDNVNYFNALIQESNISELKTIFEIDSTDAKALVGFKMDIGPETPNDLLVEYNEYINSIDSVLASTTDYDTYVENRDILGGSVFSIEAQAEKKDVFIELEKGFKKTFENEYSKKLKRIRDSTILIKKESYFRELNRIDSLQKIYLEVIQNESQKENTSSLGVNGTFPLQLERIPTREYELFQEERKIREMIRDLDEELIEESVFFDILSGFEQVGSKRNSLLSKKIVTLPLLVFSGIILAFCSIKAFTFIREYET